MRREVRRGEKKREKRRKEKKEEDKRTTSCSAAFGNRNIPMVIQSAFETEVGIQYFE